jgi:hypothetical protein
LLAATAFAWAQSVTNIYTTDINGHTEAASSVASNSHRSELSRSINGRDVPLEQTEERVLREDSTGKVTERIVRKYDPDGRLSATERTVTDERKLPGGGSSTRATTSRSDVNGQMQEAERRTIEVHPQGTGTRSQTVIERPTPNGSLEAFEKRNLVTQTTGAATHEDETVYRPSGNGGFSEALRQVRDVRKTGDQTVDHTTYYEPGVTGQLQLARQTVSTTTKRPDGSEVTEVNLYARATAGNVRDNDLPQQIQEQQIIERKKGPGDAVVETLNIRRPNPTDPNHLGELQKISETVCKGKCTPDAKP